MANEPSLNPNSETRSFARVPAYRRILDELRSRIEKGELKPGDRIESERVLAARCGVSLMTARHAINELEREGLVNRRIGAGTFVAAPKIHFNRLLSFSELMGSREVVAHTRFVGAHLIEDDFEAAARLGLPPGTAMVKLERIRYGGNEPYAFETSYLASDEFPDIARKVRARDSLFETLQRDYGMSPAYADEEVDATSAEGRVAEYLQVARGHSVLRIRQVVFAANGRRILYDVGVYRSDRHSLMIRRFR